MYKAKRVPFREQSNSTRFRVSKETIKSSLPGLAVAMAATTNKLGVTLLDLLGLVRVNLPNPGAARGAVPARRTEDVRVARGSSAAESAAGKEVTAGCKDPSLLGL